MKVEKLKKDFENWLTEIKLNKSVNTLKTYQNAVNKFFDYLEKKEIPEVDKFVIFDYENYLKKLRENGTITTNTYNSRAIILNEFFKASGLADLNIKVQKRQVKTINENAITDSDYKRLIKWCKKLGYERELLLISVLANTGVRISELEAFSIEAINNLNKENCKITVTNKGKERTIIIPDILMEQLKEYIKKNNLTEGLIFSSKYNPNKLLDKGNLSRTLKKIAGRARINKSKIYPHNFRKYYARRFMDLPEANIGTLANLLGHSSIETTRLYTLETSKKQKEIVNKMVAPTD